MSTNEESMQKKITAMGIIIALLVGAIVFLLFNRNSQSTLISEQAIELDEAEVLKEDLQIQYEEVMNALDEQKGENEELNAVIENQKSDLESRKSEISKLINSGKATKRDLSQARTDINDFQSQLGRYLAELDAVKEQNQILTKEKIQLSQEKKVLQTNIESERVNVENLNEEKAVLVGLKENLEEKNSMLNKKVNYGSVVRVTDVVGMGLKTRNSGKTVEKKYAKNTEKIQICFNTTENDLANIGNEEFLIRIINPIGETMAIEELGSGVFTSSKSKDKIRYTQKTDIEYESSKEKVCINWEPNTSFNAGMYTVEIFNKGFLAGEGSFQLK